MLISRYLDNFHIIKEKENTYACPICLIEFRFESSAIPIGLTKEHVPPRSLGGTVKCYTCSKCNSNFGAGADNQLLIGVQQNKDTFLETMIDQPIRIQQGDWTFQGQMSRGDDGIFKMVHNKKNNHPVKLEVFMGQIIDGTQLSLQYILKGFDKQLFNVGLLKSAYLQVFSNIGFEVVFNKRYDIVREQLMNPHKRIYFENTILTDAFTPDQSGVYKVDIEGHGLICAVLNLSFSGHNHTFGVLMPTIDSDFISTLSFISTIHAYTPREKKIPLDVVIAHKFNERVSGVFSLIEQKF